MTKKYIFTLSILLLGCPGKPTPKPTPPAIDCSKVLCAEGRKCIDGVGCVPITPTPESTFTCVIPAEGQIFTHLDTQAISVRKKDVREAQNEIGNVCGKNPAESLEKLASVLREYEICAGVMTDSVFVEVPGGSYPIPGSQFEEWHAVFYGDGCWTTNEAKGLWSR